MIKTYIFDVQQDKVLHDINLDHLEQWLASPDNLIWIDLYDYDADEVNRVARVFDFHPLAIEDVLHASPRAKVDRYDRYFFFVFHALRYDEESDDELTLFELDVFLGKNYIVTLHRSALPAVGRVAYHCLRGTRLMNRGPDYLIYAIVDGIIDEYFPIVERLGDRIDELEDELYINPARETTDEMLALKRTLLLLRKTVLPQKRIFSNINGRYSFEVREDNRPYYLDLVDHIERISDTIDTYRDLVNSAMDTYFSIISNRTNEIMRVLTIISTISMPLTVVTGAFGMNVPIPAQDYPFMFYAIWLSMAALSAGMIYWFRRKNWI
ncbi:magnesium and cobalt transport protein cora [Heliomicrobium modesticaldum Ice1]|uniref:Magnesium transport protein CorA n=1 Tax=Heliobacterium modesticaldum (strain ATCC 51547 / Ice1) TaxID=498761 RepID=B0TBB7_HELMI|nr:magnesium/cobalt transporter CorA [Heliomicrobium modesticaldum]ABZ85130.1 magnesium and cobalt transport protein cora [Heliomicrobium modesticaldum Ice1]